MFHRSVALMLCMLAMQITSTTSAHAADAATSAYPTEIASWDEPTRQLQRESGQRLLGQIAQAAQRGQRELKIEPGHYRFAQPMPGKLAMHVHLKDLENLTIDFQGSTLWMETGAGALMITGCRNLTLRNVFIDWDPLPYTQGRVVAINTDTHSIDVRLDEGFERVTDGLAKAAQTTGSGLRGVIFDPATRQMKPGVMGFALDAFWNNKIGERTYRIGIRGFYDTDLSDIGIAEGDLIALLKRDGRVVRINGSASVTFEDFTLYASPFVAFSAGSGEGGHVYRRTNIVRRPGTTRLLAGNADGINSSNVERGPLIESCRIEHLGDDFVNIHGHYGRVIWQETPNQIVVTRLHYRPALPEGTPLEFYTRDSVAPLGTRRVVSSQSLQWTVEASKCLADLSHRWHSGDAARLQDGQTVLATRLVLDKPIDIPRDAILISPSFIGAGGIIRDCTFNDSLARGIRLQSPNALIENNTIANTAGHAISLHSQPTFWGEGADVHSARIVGNTITRSDEGERRGGERAAIFVVTAGDYHAHPRQHDIAIENNHIQQAGGAAIVARGVRDLIVRDNHIAGHHLRPPLLPAANQKPEAGLGHAIILDAVHGSVVVENNNISSPGPHARGSIYQEQTLEQIPGQQQASTPN